MKKVSVIIPIYNGEKYLEKTILNYLKQDYLNIEFLLVDDGSMDNSLSICNRLATLDNRIKVIHQENKGVSSARNNGIKHSSGEYICFFDSDDYVDDNMISSMVEVANNTSSDMVSCGIAMELQLKSGEYVRQSELRYSDKKKELLSADKIKENILNIWEQAVPYNVVNKLYRRKLIIDNNIQFSDINMGEDLEFNSKILLYLNSIVLIPECFYRYIRDREGAATSKYVKNWFIMRQEENSRIIAFFKEYFKTDKLDAETKEYIARRYINRVIGCMENEFRGCNNENRFSSIKAMIDSTSVQESIQLGEKYSIKIKLIVFGMKNKLYIYVYVCMCFISFIKKKMPRLFEYLKYRR